MDWLLYKQPEQYCNIITIPRGCIVSIKDIELWRNYRRITYGLYLASVSCLDTVRHFRVLIREKRLKPCWRKRWRPSRRTGFSCIRWLTAARTIHPITRESSDGKESKGKEGAAQVRRLYQLHTRTWQAESVQCEWRTAVRYVPILDWIQMRTHILAE